MDCCLISCNLDACIPVGCPLAPLHACKNLHAQHLYAYRMTHDTIADLIGVFSIHACRMTHDTIADRLGVFSIHVPGSPVGQGRPVIGSTGYVGWKVHLVKFHVPPSSGWVSKDPFPFLSSRIWQSPCTPTAICASWVGR
eukprot:848899-Pelagomonas_calceolata.AAC.1